MVQNLLFFFSDYHERHISESREDGAAGITEVDGPTVVLDESTLLVLRDKNLLIEHDWLTMGEILGRGLLCDSVRNLLDNYTLSLVNRPLSLFYDFRTLWLCIQRFHQVSRRQNRSHGGCENPTP